MSKGNPSKAIRLLKLKPFEFIDHGEFRSPRPKDFVPKFGNKDWEKATACMSVLRDKPANWHWTLPRLQKEGLFSENVVKRGIKKLKEEGWIQYVNLYDENGHILTTHLLVFSSPIAEDRRRTRRRFRLHYSEEGWDFGWSGEICKPHTGVSKKREGVLGHPCPEHIDTVVITQTLKRASSDSLGCAEAENPISVASPVSENQKPINPVEPPEPPKEELIAKRERITRRLEELGKQKEDSEDAELAYEEFVVTEVIPELTLPPRKKDGEARRKLWCLNWVEESLLGMILLQMSTSPGWNVNCARRIIKRADDGYLQWEDLKSILFAFDWNRGNDNRKTLDAMTFYGKRPDAMDGGRIKTIDGWGLGVRAAKRTYKEDIVQTVKEQCNRLYPDEHNAWAVSHSFIDRVNGELDDITTGKVEPDEDSAFALSVHETDALAYAFSSKPLSEKSQKKIDDSHDEIVKFLATDYTGILLYKSKGHLLAGALGVEPAEVRKAHHEHVDKISRRMSYHGLSNTEVVPHI